MVQSVGRVHLRLARCGPAIVAAAALALAGIAPAAAAEPGALADAQPLALGGSAVAAAAAPYEPAEYKVVVTGIMPPGGIAVWGGVTAEGAFISVSGERDYKKKTTFYSFRGTTYSQYACGTSERPQTYRYPVKRWTNGTTTTLWSSPCPVDELVSLSGAFEWGSPGDRFATNSFRVWVYLPGAYGYDTIVPTPDELLGGGPQAEGEHIYPGGGE